MELPVENGMSSSQVILLSYVRVFLPSSSRPPHQLLSALPRSPVQQPSSHPPVPPANHHPSRARSRMNGATQTFRRPSVATNPSQNRDTSQSTSVAAATGTYNPPHVTTSSTLRNGAATETRYSKEQLLSLYKSQRESGVLGKNVAEYFVADWDPHVETPAAVNGAWGRREDSKDANPSGPEVCWDHGGQSEPLGLIDMTEDEKEVRLALVSSGFVLRVGPRLTTHL